MSNSTSRHHRRHGSASAATKSEIARLLRNCHEAALAGRVIPAIELCERVLALDRQNLDALCIYSSLAIGLGQPDAAAQAGRRATMLSPDHAEAHHCLGVALRALGQIPDAMGSLGRAIELQPDHVDSLLQLAQILLDAGDNSGAEPFLNRALDIDSNTSSAQLALGRFYRNTGRLDDAMAAFRRAIKLDPRQTEARMLLGNMLRDAGDLDGALNTFRQAIAVAPNRPDAWSGLLLTLQCADSCSADETAEMHREFGRHFQKLLLPMPSSPWAPVAGRKLRIGYVSSNFRRHAISKFFEPLMTAHDRSRFEIYCYYNYAISDEVTRRIGRDADRFTSINSMTDGHFAAQVRRDEVDILVDLDGHTAPNRSPVFFLRPAPVQIAWLGYLSSTGNAAIDYRLTDALADPPGDADDRHVETLWRLPTTAWCYRPYDEAPLPGPPPFAANGFVSFASLNDPGKLTVTLMELWVRIMREVEMSRLILHVSRQPSRIAEVEAFFSARGISASRLALVHRQPIEQYLALYNHADIALDTWPCAGGTTTCDALWMGVPVVTLSGHGSYSRTGVSLLNTLGLSELAAETAEGYVSNAVGLARDRSRLATLRAGLRLRMRSSALMDAGRFARDIEAAYLAMWDRHGADRKQRST